VQFLEKVAPGVERQLARNLREDPLRGYDVNWGEDGSKVECIHELRYAGAKQAFLDDAGDAMGGGGDGEVRGGRPSAVHLQEWGADR
jgi:hypothetical protein